MRKTLFIVILIVISTAIIWQVGLVSAQVKNLSTYINEYRAKRDNAKQIERSTDSKNKNSNPELLQAKKDNLSSSVDLMINYIRTVRDTATGAELPDSIKSGSAYLQINDNTTTLKSYQAEIKNSNDLSNLKTIARNLRNLWRTVKISTMDNSCVILNQRLENISGSLDKSVNKDSSTVSDLKKQNKDTTRVEFIISNNRDQISKINGKIEENKLRCSFNGNLTRYQSQISIITITLQQLETISSDIDGITTELERLAPQPTSKSR